MHALAPAAAAFAAVVYWKRARRVPVARWKQASFAVGLVVLAGATFLPAHDLFSAHMLQHILLGDLAPLALLAGLSGPLLAPVLRRLHRLRVLAHPLVALPLWALNLYAWHLPFLYEAALHHELVHTIEHACFFTAGAIMWMPVLETLPAPEWFGTTWKLGYIVAVRLVGAVLANVLLWTGHPLYDGYTVADRVDDQTTAAAIMMVEGSLLTLVLFGWLFLRAAREGEERQALLDLARARGVELSERRAARAVAAGRGAELSRRIEAGS